MRDIAKVAGRPDLHDVDIWSGAIRLGFGQPQNPPHPLSPGRQRPNRSYRLRPHPPLSGHSRRFTKKRVGSTSRCNRKQEARFKRSDGLYREILALFAFGLQRDEPLRRAAPTSPCFAGRTAVFDGRTRPHAARLCWFLAQGNWSNALRHHRAYDIRQRHTKSLGPSRHLLDEAPFLTLGLFVDQDRGTLDDFPESNHPKAFKGLQEFVEVDPDLIGVDDDLLDGQFDRRCFLTGRSLFSWSGVLCAFSRGAGHGNT